MISTLDKINRMRYKNDKVTVLTVMTCICVVFAK